MADVVAVVAVIAAVNWLWMEVVRALYQLETLPLSHCKGESTKYLNYPCPIHFQVCIAIVDIHQSCTVHSFHVPIPSQNTIFSDQVNCSHHISWIIILLILSILLIWDTHTHLPTSASPSLVYSYSKIIKFMLLWGSLFFSTPYQ